MDKVASSPLLVLSRTITINGRCKWKGILKPMDCGMLLLALRFNGRRIIKHYCKRVTCIMASDLQIYTEVPNTGAENSIKLKFGFGLTVEGTTTAEEKLFSSSASSESEREKF